MKILLDTSVLVAAMIKKHPAHTQCLPYLQQIKQDKVQGVIVTHTLAELYSILTRLPMKPILSSKQVQQLLHENILNSFQIVDLSKQDYLNIINHLADIGLIGGVTYDALILYTALKTNVDKVLTLNERDFRRIYPKLIDKIVSP